MANFLRSRNKHFYFRIRIPSDLHHVIPETELLKSLRTKHRKSAMIAASRLYSSILEVFALSRSGFILPIQAKERVDGILGRNTQKPQLTGASPLLLCPLPLSPSLVGISSRIAPNVHRIIAV